MGVRVDGDHLVIDRPNDIAAVRARIRAEADARGTWGVVPQAGDGWAARAEDFYLSEWAHESKVTPLYTFDKKLAAQQDGVELL